MTRPPPNCCSVGVVTFEEYLSDSVLAAQIEMRKDRDVEAELHLVGEARRQRGRGAVVRASGADLGLHIRAQRNDRDVRVQPQAAQPALKLVAVCSGVAAVLNEESSIGAQMRGAQVQEVVVSAARAAPRREAAVAVWKRVRSDTHTGLMATGSHAVDRKLRVA